MTTLLRIEPRWTDLDPVGHVNNTVFLVYAEEARNRFLSVALPDAWGSIVVVHNAIDYHHPVVQTDVVEVSSAVEAIGATSFTTINVIATATHRCATVRTVQVVLREDRSATRPWTAGERAALEKLLAAVESPTSSSAPGTRPPAP
ncbi:MAG: thioesterase family protein [Mycobacterium sp.]|uniref:acyl-CoA thioesterase n=1 Tax=Mycobacterium sp. TaxID=1785 RepID=UPI003BAF9889